MRLHIFLLASLGLGALAAPPGNVNNLLNNLDAEASEDKHPPLAQTMDAIEDTYMKTVEAFFEKLDQEDDNVETFHDHPQAELIKSLESGIREVLSLAHALGPLIANVTAELQHLDDDDAGYVVKRDWRHTKERAVLQALIQAGALRLPQFIEWLSGRS
ncbi:hypothetical protein SLS57_004853 [Botryosphaeria dothidea]